MPPRPRTIARKMPAQDRARATVDALLEATARILVKEGYDHASTNRIAEAAGVSVGSLYQYFPSKEALVAALIDRHMTAMTDMLERQAATLANAPLAVAVREAIRVMIAAHGIDPRLHRVLAEQVPRLGRLQRVEQVLTKSRELVRAYLEAHRAEVRPRDLDMAAFLMAHTVEAVTHGAVLHEPALLKSEALVEETTALLVRYLTKV
jgi:AcrR family transcriptional regulator